jgi:hypothetical protein
MAAPARDADMSHGRARVREVGMGAGRPARLLVLTGVATLVLAGCGGGGGDAKLKRAESRVSDQQKALSDAQAELATNTDAFCKSSSTYITALDRYGDVLHLTATTVGDVKDAGTELEQPRQDVISSAEAVEDAQKDVVAAEKDLAEAKAALAAV